MRIVTLAAIVVSFAFVAHTSSPVRAAAVAEMAVHAAASSHRVPNPIVTPAVGGHGQAGGGLRYDVTQFGYQEREYFFEGTATTYGPVVSPPAPYRSRMIAWTPHDPSRFNGTTVVEWAEVSDFGQFELTVELNYQSPILEQQGYAFVLVSAEQRGICDRTADGCTSTSLQGADPARYGSLDHPGDAYSFDIFSQALQAIKHPTGTAPLGKLKTRSVIAEGFQRSIDKYFPVGAPVSSTPSTSPISIYGPLNDYLANGADDDARLADAFLIDAAAPAVEPARYRVPTLHHLDESAIRRIPTPDRRNHVTWEVVGAPHADRWSGGHIEIPSPNGPLSPIIDVPVAAYNGEACISSGTMTQLPPQRLAQLYPTHERYVRRLLNATNDAVANRFLMCIDAETIMRKASASTVGGTDPLSALPKCAKRRS